LDANTGAPVFSEGAIEIAASPEELWDLMADVERWPVWNSDVEWVRLEGRVDEGSVFRWKGGSTTIVSTLKSVRRPSEIGWTGRTMGIRAIHVWRFESAPTGAIARMEESFEGGITKLMRTTLQRQLDKATQHGLRALKAAAERSHAGD
jgi:hypothetical protein